ncbi:hypothetical protein GCM10020295_49410 [Streptomyces cinereospinus]
MQSRPCFFRSPGTCLGPRPPRGRTHDHELRCDRRRLSVDLPGHRSAAPAATLGGDRKGSVEQGALLLFIIVPFLALVAAVPLAWGRG